ncbi:DUF2850 domain-containing protein [Vibrio cholerae]|uniref:DUF2850 domain-containing protein n=1 Tax=Vibrio metoecus TaxID=1481663 RepID=A0A0Q0SUU3_VIBMT|nr:MULTISPECIES: DUF2850 domain-containing protein [Vibrio]EEX66009.1 hypothetical protein VCJ_001689 [Vibrio metoecus]EHS1088316.1 DUF2850 domain-containing protein [Vibrio cholerae]EKE8762050.1 DUF2850 domain-containing protein [Vibrio cholerae]EKE8763507.1 DUF2850 domain-containing protein [Vibrio cholerae]EKF9297198.1 DUF2850 domain-containing protein [Vibrio cholerae]
MVKAERQANGKNGALSKERLLLLLAVLGTAYVFMLYSNIFGRLQEQWFPKSELYGVWVEQNVATYSAQKITIGTQGVILNGRLVTTHFDYDGAQLEFMVNGQPYRFEIMLEKKQMKQRSSAHYQPVYQLSENSKKNFH